VCIWLGVLVTLWALHIRLSAHGGGHVYTCIFAFAGQYFCVWHFLPPVPLAHQHVPANRSKDPMSLPLPYVSSVLCDVLLKHGHLL
jgi:hypothetical protein